MIYQCTHLRTCIVFSQQVKWNRFIMTSAFMYRYIHICIRGVYIHICVVSSRRNKTNPYHRNKFIPVLYATQLQAFKPKLSTYDQLLPTNQQAVSFDICVCVRKLKHFQPHSLLCHLWCESFHAIRSFEMWFHICMKMMCQVDEAASTNFFFSSHTIDFTLLNNCITHSHTSRTIASSQYHPRETRSLLGRPNLYKTSIIWLAHDEFVSYYNEK